MNYFIFSKRNMPTRLNNMVTELILLVKSPMVVQMPE